MTADFLDALLRAAEACEKEEEAVRRESEARLEALTKARVAAYRRYHLLRGMAEAIATAAPAEAGAGVTAALDFAFAETGWNEEDGLYSEVRGELTAVAKALAAHPPEEKAAILAFARFESWYKERLASDFLDLLERERAFLPVVDF